MYQRMCLYDFIVPAANRNIVCAIFWRGCHSIPVSRFAKLLLDLTLEALCKDAGQSDPLYDCSIFSNKKAGDHFMELLKLGRSKPWQEAILKGNFP